MSFFDDVGKTVSDYFSHVPDAIRSIGPYLPPTSGLLEKKDLTGVVRLDHAVMAAYVITGTLALRDFPALIQILAAKLESHATGAAESLAAKSLTSISASARRSVGIISLIEKVFNQTKPDMEAERRIRLASIKGKVELVKLRLRSTRKKRRRLKSVLSRHK